MDARLGKLYFVTGSDKLYVLPRWHRIDEMLEQFHVFVAKRGEDDLEQIKEIMSSLAERWDAFTVFPIPDEFSFVLIGKRSR